DVSDGDRDRLRLVANGAALRDVRVGLRCTAVLSGRIGHQRSGQRRLAVVDVTDRPYVHVRLLALENALSHGSELSWIFGRFGPASRVGSPCLESTWSNVVVLRSGSRLQCLLRFGLLRFRRPSLAVGAGDGNRTHVASLEGSSSTIELH